MHYYYILGVGPRVDGAIELAFHQAMMNSRPALEKALKRKDSGIRY